MRLVFINPVGVIGGAERVLLAAIRGAREHLPAARIDVVQFADGPLRAEAGRLGADVTVVPLPASLAGLGDTRLRGRDRVQTLVRLGWAAIGEAPTVVGFIRRLRAALRRLAPDLIHSNGLKAHALAALARPRGVPVLWHLHDFPSHRPVMARLLRLLSVAAAGGIAVSEAVRRDAEAVLPGLAISVVLNAVDTDHFTPADRDGAELDRLAGLPPAASGTVRVGLVATYANWKGQDVFLDALAQLPATGPPVRGYVVGGPIYTTAGSQFTRDELERRAAANGSAGRVGFIPFVPDPADVYRMFDVAVHASTRPEPFGLTIAEAMGCGRPVVVAAAGGAAELFTPGHDGLGHAPGDVIGLADAIARLAADPGLRARLGANARRTAVEQFSRERYGREMAAVYAACLRDRTRPGWGGGALTESLLELRSASCPSRILFLDDDPMRAAAFRAEYPDAVWVQTAEQCLACLAEPWDEVHLDHDLGGEIFVAHGREDCGMAVVRWLCEQPRPHLRPTRFIVHTYNPNAACMMLLHLQVMGFDVQARPFGSHQSRPDLPQGPPGRRPRAGRPMLMRWLRYLRGA